MAEENRTDLGTLGGASLALSGTAGGLAAAGVGSVAVGAASIALAPLAIGAAIVGGALLATDWIADSASAAKEDTQRMHDLAKQIEQFGTDKELLGKDMAREIATVGESASSQLEQSQFQVGSALSTLGKSIDTGMKKTSGLVSGELIEGVQDQLDTASTGAEMQAIGTTEAAAQQISGVKSKYDAENRELLAHLELIKDEHQDLVDEAGGDEKINFWDRML